MSIKLNTIKKIRQKLQADIEYSISQIAQSKQLAIKDIESLNLNLLDSTIADIKINLHRLRYAEILLALISEDLDGETLQQLA